MLHIIGIGVLQLHIKQPLSMMCLRITRMTFMEIRICPLL